MDFRDEMSVKGIGSYRLRQVMKIIQVMIDFFFKNIMHVVFGELQGDFVIIFLVDFLTLMQHVLLLNKQATVLVEKYSEPVYQKLAKELEKYILIVTKEPS